MEIEINQIKIAASWECSQCGDYDTAEIWHDLTHNEVSIEAMIQRVFDSDHLAGWDLEDSLCPSCVEEDN